MNKRIIVCITFIFIVIVIAIFFFMNYKIVQRQTFVRPNSEYYSNSFLALERWLNNTNRPVKVLHGYMNHDNIKENTIIFISSSFLLTEFINNNYLQKIKDGKNVIICLTDIDNYREEVTEMLSDLGISLGTTPSYHTYSTEDTPDYHWNYKFLIEDGKEYILNYDIHNNIRIVRIPLDKGMLTIMGTPRFMTNSNIGKEANARLTWEIIGNCSDETGVLFIKPYLAPAEEKALFGVLMQKGNLIPVIASIVLIIIFGFWMVIPVFGQAKVEKHKNARPIKERFIAEIGFLKKYKSLYYYDNALTALKDEKTRSKNEANKS